MELIEVIQQIAQKNQQAMQPTDLAIGTVTAADPLEIMVNPQAAPLRREVLYLTAAVIEKKISDLSHSHTTTHTHPIEGAAIQPAGTCSVELSSIACYENGAALPKESGYITLNRALAVGDKVLLLRVQQGQKYVVLSRVFEGV